MIGTTAALIMGGLSAAGAIGGAKIGASAASKAAKAQAAAAIEAGKITQGTADEQAQKVIDAAESSASGVREAMQAGQDVIGSTAETGQKTLAEAQAGTQGTLKDVYGTGMEALAPYLKAGNVSIEQLMSLMAPGGEFNRKFSTADYQEDPGYQFRLQEGQKALERSASARGGVLGGGTLKALSGYSQGMASQEYQNAFERFQSENQARYGRLTGLANIGQTATQQQNQLGEWYGGQTSDLNKWYGSSSTDLGKWAGGLSVANLMEGMTKSGQFRTGGYESGANLRMRGAEGAANAITGAGNASAAGTLAGGNAWAQGISGGASSMMNAILLSQLMKPTAATTRPTA
jgi:hypothetical protein